MATTSACAVGSLVDVTLFTPLAITFPSFTITAPKGPPFPFSTFAIERRMAFFMNLAASFLPIVIILLLKITIMLHLCIEGIVTPPFANETEYTKNKK